MGNFKTDPGLTVVEGPIAEVNDFKYLGSWVTSSYTEILRFGELTLGNLMCMYILSYQDTPAVWSRSVDTDKRN